MKRFLNSLRFRIVLPVAAMTLFIVIVLTSLFSRAYTSMILKQEQEVNAVGFDTVSRSLTPLIESSIGQVRSILSDDRIISCIKSQNADMPEKIHRRIQCRDFLREEIARDDDGIFGLLFMRFLCFLIFGCRNFLSRCVFGRCDIFLSCYCVDFFLNIFQSLIHIL